MKAYLILEDGSIFEGDSFGFEGENGGEVVFNTSLTGYQEILSDPSYSGQILTMTYPQIGNCGVNEEDMESASVHASGFIVKEYSAIHSNWRSKGSLGDFLKKHGIIGIQGVDTRAITRKIRNEGAMRGYLACGEFSKTYLREKLAQVPSMNGLNLADGVSTEKEYIYSEDNDPGKNSTRIVALDMGIKSNILRELRRPGVEITVVPSSCDARAILEKKPDGVILSNGPGDPAAVTTAINTVRGLLGKVPLMGICLGHQILSLALGAKTFKLKFGHRGANHPVKNMEKGFVEITSQNHGFAVDADSLEEIDDKYGKVGLTHVNLSDGTVEGIKCPGLKAMSVQYHPEASPGPHDSKYLFDDFFKLMERDEFVQEDIR